MQHVSCMSARILAPSALLSLPDQAKLVQCLSRCAYKLVHGDDVELTPYIRVHAVKTLAVR